MKKALFFFASVVLISKLASAQSVTIVVTTLGPTNGTVYYNNATNQLQYWNGTIWVNLTKSNWVDIYNSNAGNVGIGTSTPVNKLQIGSFNPFLLSCYDIAFGNNIYAGGLKQGLSYASWISYKNIALLPMRSIGKLGINTIALQNTLQVGDLGTGYTGNDIAFGKNGYLSGFQQTLNNATLYSKTNLVFQPNDGYGTGNIGINTFFSN